MDEGRKLTGFVLFFVLLTSWLAEEERLILAKRTTCRVSWKDRGKEGGRKKQKRGRLSERCYTEYLTCVTIDR